MVCYIHCKLYGRDLLINEDNPEDIRSYVIRCNQYDKVGKTYLTKIKISSYKSGYKYININSSLGINDKKIKIKLHRLNYYAHNQDWNILDNSKNNFIDHIDNNPTNNDISNLRVVTQQQNSWNRHNVRGYSITKNGRYKSQIVGEDSRQIYLGTYDTKEEARNKHLEAKKIYHII